LHHLFNKQNSFIVTMAHTVYDTAVWYSTLFYIETWL